MFGDNSNGRNSGHGEVADSPEPELRQTDGVDEAYDSTETVTSVAAEEAEDAKNYLEAPYSLRTDYDESIVLNNGALMHSVTDFVLPGRNGFDLAITRRYNSDSAGTTEMNPTFNGTSTYGTAVRVNSHNIKQYGLGFGWYFVLPSMEIVSAVDRKSNIKYSPFLHLTDGRNFTVSGSTLKDHTLKDVSIEKKTETLTHPWRSDVVRNYNYVVSYKSGGKDYFQLVYDASGKEDCYHLVARQDRFENLMCFYMTNYGGMRIVDTWGRDIVLQKSGSTLKWVLPENKSVTYRTDGENGLKLTSVTDQVGRVTRYAYNDPEVYSAHCKYAGSGKGDNSSNHFQYMLLSAVTHPTGAVTEYHYGALESAGMPVPLSVTINTLGGFRKYFPMLWRRDVAGGQDYKTERYKFTLSADGKYIEKADVVFPFDVTELHTFNDKSQLIEKAVRHSKKLVTSGKYTYGTTATKEDYKLITGQEDFQYQPTDDPEKEGTVYVKKTTGWTYTADKKGDVAKLTESYSDEAAFDRVTEMAYGNYSILTERKVRKDADTVIAERYALRPAPDDKVVEFKRVFDIAGGDAPIETLREKTRYLYSDAADNKYCVVEEQRFYTEDGEPLDDSTQHTSSFFRYDGRQFTHAPVGSRLTGLKDADGNPLDDISTSTAYNAYGQPLVQTDALGRETDFEYDALGRTVRETYPETDGVRYFKRTRYDDRNNTILQTDENGYTKRFVYTPMGDIQRVYLSEMDIPSSGDILLNSYAYDALGRTIAELAYDGTGEGEPSIKSRTQYTYDQFDRVLGKVVPQVQYDETHRYDDVYTPDDAPGKKRFRHTKEVVGEPGAPGVATATVSDQLGHTLEEYLAGRRTAAYTYDIAGNKTAQVDATGNTTWFTYDYASRVVETRRKVGGTDQSSTTRYDELGNKVAATDYAGNTTHSHYDTAGRLLKQDSPFDAERRATTKYTYDAAGNLLAQALDQGDYWRKTGYCYDARGRQTDVFLYLDDACSRYSQTQYTYDGVGNKLEMRTGLTDDNADYAAVCYRYDRLGNVTAITDALEQVERNTYGPTGLLTQKTDRNGNTTHYTHDALDRLVAEKVTVPSPRGDGIISTEKHYSYTKSGQKREETLIQRCCGAEERHTIRYTYNGEGRLIAQEDPGGIQKRFTYDSRGNRDYFELRRADDPVPEIGLRYLYDELNRLVRVRRTVQTVAILAEYEYDASGNRTALRYPGSGIETIYRYNQANLVVALANKQNGEMRSAYDYRYSLDGNQVEKRSGGNTAAYAYDRAGRLVVEDDAQYSRIKYTYDRFSNRVSMQVVPNGVQVEKPYETVYHYDRNNRLLEEVKTDHTGVEHLFYGYDPNGSQTRRERTFAAARNGERGAIGFVTGAESRGAVTLDLRAYNGLGQLIEVSRDMARTAYTYRPDGLRHQKTVTQTLHNKTTTTRHHWDGQNMVMETNGQTGRTKARYLRGSGLVCQVIDLSLAFYLLNAHGDVTRRVDTAGNTLAKYDYDAFGNRRWEPDADTLAVDGLETDPNPFRYCGEYWDADIKEVYLRNRTYNPRNGRFSSSDPAKSGLNWYRYAKDNPGCYHDPLGLKAKKYRSNDDNSGTGYEVVEREIDEEGNVKISIVVVTETGRANVSYTIGANRIISYDFTDTENEKITMMEPYAIGIVAQSMFDFMVEYESEGLYDRTLSGLVHEIQWHYSLYKLTGLENLRIADMGGMSKEKPGYDSNAWVFEELGYGKTFDYTGNIGAIIPSLSRPSLPSNTGKPSPNLGPSPQNPGALRYRVQAGDSFWAIADRIYGNGIYWAMVQAAAGKSWIDPGDVLFL